jgi:hypothetical protein
VGGLARNGNPQRHRISLFAVVPHVLPHSFATTHTYIHVMAKPGSRRTGCWMRGEFYRHENADSGAVKFSETRWDWAILTARSEFNGGSRPRLSAKTTREIGAGSAPAVMPNARPTHPNQDRGMP